MTTLIELLSEHLRQAIDEGVFNDVWYYIKDYKNYKLQFTLEYPEDDRSTVILGELNPHGFKDMSGNFYTLNLTNWSRKYQKEIPSKFNVDYLYESHKFPETPGPTMLKVFDSADYLPLPKDFVFEEEYDVKIDPVLFHTKNNAFSVNLNLDSLHKVEEVITYYIFSKEATRKYLFNLCLDFYNDVIDEFGAKFYFTSIITDEKNNTIPNNFLSYDDEIYESRIMPLDLELISQVYSLLEIPFKLSKEFPNLPKTLLDDLNEIEMREETQPGDYEIIFLKYHRLVERLANKIFNDKYEEIKKVIASSNDNTRKRNFIIKKMEVDNGDFRIMNLNKFSDFLKFLTDKEVNMLNKEAEVEVNKKFIPLLRTFSGFSNLRNHKTHDYINIDEGILISGIKALKKIIHDGFILFYDKSKNK